MMHIMTIAHILEIMVAKDFSVKKLSLVPLRLARFMTMCINEENRMWDDQ
jgi:hypothetical protein